MSAEQIPPPGLLDAQRRIRILLDDLDGTVESVRRLHRIGEDGIALGLINEQRARLDGFVDEVARDIAAPSRTFARRRKMVLGLAAAALGLAAAALIVLVQQTTSRPSLRAQIGPHVEMVQPIREVAAIVRTPSTARNATASSAWTPAASTRHVRYGQQASILAEVGNPRSSRHMRSVPATVKDLVVEAAPVQLPQ